MKTFFKAINPQRYKSNRIVKKGAIVDASVMDTPHRPKGNSILKVTEDRSEEEVEITKEYADSVDQEGSWLKKRGQLHFGYTKHPVRDEEGLVLGVLQQLQAKIKLNMFSALHCLLPVMAGSG